jgi:hypothetical protein
MVYPENNFDVIQPECLFGTFQPKLQLAASKEMTTSFDIFFDQTPLKAFGVYLAAARQSFKLSIPP